MCSSDLGDGGRRAPEAAGMPRRGAAVVRAPWAGSGLRGPAAAEERGGGEVAASDRLAAAMRLRGMLPLGGRRWPARWTRPPAGGHVRRRGGSWI